MDAHRHTRCWRVLARPSVVLQLHARTHARTYLSDCVEEHVGGALRRRVSRVFP